MRGYETRGAADPQRINIPLDASGFRLPVGERLALPATEKPRFIVSIDTEEEFDWSRPFERDQAATQSIEKMPDLTRRFNDHGVKPVFLCVYPVVDRPESRDIMAQLATENGCEIGAHLHPWVTPPFDEDLNQYNSFAGNLPRGLQRAKLLCLTEKITETTGVRPVIYRAGRYGIGATTMQLLKELGYTVDVSVRPLFDYADEGGPDFRTHPIWPWRDDNGMIEIPLSAARLGALRGFSRLPVTGPLANILAQLRLMTRVPLTPEGIPLKEALEAIRVLHGEGQNLFSFSFHSPSAAIGFTPYVRDAKDLAKFWDWWTGVISLLVKLGVEPATYGEVAPLLGSAR